MPDERQARLEAKVDAILHELREHKEVDKQEFALIRKSQEETTGDVVTLKIRVAVIGVLFTLLMGAFQVGVAWYVTTTLQRTVNAAVNEVADK